MTTTLHFSMIKNAIHKHIFLNKIHDKAITRKAKKLSREYGYKFSYTNTIEWMTEVLLEDEDKQLKKYLALQTYMDELEEE